LTQICISLYSEATNVLVIWRIFHIAYLDRDVARVGCAVRKYFGDNNNSIYFVNFTIFSKCLVRGDSALLFFVWQIKLLRISKLNTTTGRDSILGYELNRVSS
jgi:hypothetical protein